MHPRSLNLELVVFRLKIRGISNYSPQNLFDEVSLLFGTMSDIFSLNYLSTCVFLSI